MKIQKTTLRWAAMLIAVLAMGYFWGKHTAAHGPVGGAAAVDGTHDYVTPAALWTCSMHPQIKLPKPGKCPICFMDLIPLKQSNAGERGAATVTISESAKKLAEIVTAPVIRQEVIREVRLPGKVDYDESRVKSITARFAGRIDRLFVDYTGVRVKAGEHLFSIYSPELYTAQQELLGALDAARQSGQGQSSAAVERVREKLYLWGLNRTQVAEMEQTGKAETQVTITAPLSGTVIVKNIQEGTYVNPGMDLYTIADLSQVWIQVEAYESDLPWVRYGQEMTFTALAVPGKTFMGRVAFIDPVLSPETRTVKVRVNVPNGDGLLKPGMLIDGTLQAVLGPTGTVIDEKLAGKWISPMHPEIIKDHPGTCDVCGMPLVRAAELGFVARKKGQQPSLVIPASAPLVTGKRAVVYVELPGKDKPTYEGREVVLGPRAGDYYMVLSGLQEGERVVSQGAFKIDSELQIEAKPSLMSPSGSGTMPGHQHGAIPGTPRKQDEKTAAPTGTEDDFAGSLGPVYAAYFAAQKSLAGDDLAGAKKYLAALRQALEKVDMTKIRGKAHESWMNITAGLDGELLHVPHMTDLAAVRKTFSRVSSLMIEMERNFGHTGTQTHFVAYCPMAFGKGATWLQTDETIKNPFYGASMLSCGEIKEQLQPHQDGGK